MTVPGGGSDEKSQEDANQPSPSVGVLPCGAGTPPACGGQTPALPDQDTPHDSPGAPAPPGCAPPSTPPTPAHPPAGYPDDQPIVGIVLSAVALNQIKQNPQEGHGLAVAGIVVGIAALVVNLIVITYALR